MYLHFSYICDPDAYSQVQRVYKLYVWGFYCVCLFVCLATILKKSVVQTHTTLEKRAKN